MDRAHPVMEHTDGTKCIWVGDYWFVPLDAGGEGYECPGEHPVPHSILKETFDAGRRHAKYRIADACCSCPRGREGQPLGSVTCPVHGHGTMVQWSDIAKALKDIP